MVRQRFHFAGESTDTAFELDLSSLNDIRGLQWTIGSQLDVVQPQGEGFEAERILFAEIWQVSHSTYKMVQIWIGMKL